MEITDIITQAAQEAAQASMDAHGEYVEAQLAWDFITGVWADTDEPMYDVLPDTVAVNLKTGAMVMPAAFAAAYAQEVAQ